MAEEQEEAVNKCMAFIPDEMDKDEGRNLMIFLYKAGFVSDYLDALDTADEDSLNGDGKMIVFNDYFDVENEIKIDPQTGRITYLNLDRREYITNDDDEEEESLKPFDLPSMIEEFDSLKEIRLWNCHLIPIELGNLSQLKSIFVYQCHNNLLENILEGLQLPSSTQEVNISFSGYNTCSSLSPFMKILPDALCELSFQHIPTREQIDEVLHILQKDDLIFSQSLTRLGMTGYTLNEDDLELILFEIQPNFLNLHTVNMAHSQIKSLLDIEARIKSMPLLSSSSSSSSSTSSPQIKLLNTHNLRKIDLRGNPVFRDAIIKKATSIDPKEKEAVLTILNTFDRVSNLGLLDYNVCDYDEDKMYDPDIEYLLRKNKVNIKFTTTTTEEEGDTPGCKNNATIINRSLWPLIFERAFKKSHEIYESYGWNTQQQDDRKKCATGLFELVRNGPFFAEDSNVIPTAIKKKLLLLLVQIVAAVITIRR